MIFLHGWEIQGGKSLRVSESSYQIPTCMCLLICSIKCELGLILLGMIHNRINLELNRQQKCKALIEQRRRVFIPFKIIILGGPFSGGLSLLSYHCDHSSETGR